MLAIVIPLVAFLILFSSSTQTKASELHGNDLGIKPIGITNGNKLSSKLAQSADKESDKAFWEVIEGSDDIELYESYLKWFPNGIYAEQAKSEIKRLKAKGPDTTKAGQNQTPSQAGRYKPGQTFKDCDVCPEMVVVPAGSFMMGSPEGEDGREKDEGPQRTVKISRPFAIGKYEVTFEEWDACAADGGCKYKPDDKGWGRGRRPVINVSWDDITTEYIPWLNKKTGKTYSLPSEAEWEYAARAMSKARFHFGDLESDLCKYANAADKSTDISWRNESCDDGMGEKTALVGSYKPNAFGLYDVHGNVGEWVKDCWHWNYKGAPTDGSAWLNANNGDCTKRILRGGSWSIGPRVLRSANRGWVNSGYRYDGVGGFRVSSTLEN